MSDSVLTLSDFNPVKGVYAKAKLFAPYAEMGGFDIYGLNLAITDFSAVPDTGSVSGIRITGAASIRIISARTTAYSFERYLVKTYPELVNPEVELNGTISVAGTRAGRRVYGEFSFAAKPPILRARLDNLAYAGYDLPGFMRGAYTFEHVLSGLPCRILFNQLKIENQMLVIS